MDSLHGQIIKFVLGVALVLAVIGGILKTWFVDVVVVGHNAMAPTMFMGDTVLVWRGASMETGDIVVCRHPQEQTRFVMGRIIAGNGGQVRIERNQLYINNRRPDVDAHGEIMWPDRETGRTVRMGWGWELLGSDRHLFFRRNDRPFTLRAMTGIQGVYLLSDNRSYTGEDSRAFGVVQSGSCIGQVFMRIEQGAGNSVPDPVPYGRFAILD